MCALKKTKQSDTKTINKLILVGNGFDLSLGLATKYEDFFYWYFKNFINKSLKSREHIRDKDGYLKYSYNEDELFVFYSEINYNFDSRHIESFRKDIIDFEGIKKFILSSSYQFIYHFKSKLLEKIFKDSLNGWVDIESVYFNLLKEGLNKSSNNIDKLNIDLKELKELLRAYLKQLDYSKTKEKEVAIKHIEQFAKDISFEELPSNYSYDYEKINTGEMLFLNFNYTQSLDNIIDKLPDYFNAKDKYFGMSSSHIHGDLISKEASIVFGYGDEMDKDYKIIEELNDKRYFENIKSFKYLENNAYRELLRYLNYEDYQVIIYGHSCGLSDRVMLNEIFEHKNCKSIKICFYDKAEFISKTMSISLHFNSNQLMRQIVLPFSADDKIPQL